MSENCMLRYTNPPGYGKLIGLTGWVPQGIACSLVVFSQKVYKVLQDCKTSLRYWIETSVLFEIKLAAICKKRSSALYVLYYELWLPKPLGRQCGEEAEEGTEGTPALCPPLSASDWDSFSNEHTWRNVELFDGSYKLVAGIKFLQCWPQAQTNYQWLFLHHTTRPLLLASLKTRETQCLPGVMASVSLTLLASKQEFSSFLV